MYTYQTSMPTVMYVMSSGKTQLMKKQKVQALIGRHAVEFCGASDQSKAFLSHISICTKHFSTFLHNFQTVLFKQYMVSRFYFSPSSYCLNRKTPQTLTMCSIVFGLFEVSDTCFLLRCQCIADWSGQNND